VDAPHDKPALNPDCQGHLWVFVSGRGRKRPGAIHRSVRQYSIDAFEKVGESEFTYPQIWADGNPDKLSESHLSFCDSTGKNVRCTPYDLSTALASPETIGNTKSAKP
jgi:hypothetical protein